MLTSDENNGYLFSQKKPRNLKFYTEIPGCNLLAATRYILLE